MHRRTLPGRPPARAVSCDYTYCAASKTTREPRSFSAAALATGTPLLLWQALFFMGAGVVLVLMSFWTIKNFRLVPEYSLENWRDLLEDNLFRLIYLRTILYAGLAAILATLFAFPLAYGLAFTLLARARRVGLLLLIVPFFTSYLVRIYAWTFILADDGPINYALRSIGLPGFGMQGTLFAMEIGLLTAVFPLVTLILLLSLMNVDRTLIEAAHNRAPGAGAPSGKWSCRERALGLFPRFRLRS
ncbi:MAG: hypothetical protein R2853_15015 [Thermomicrobiales bacterium]